MEWEAKRGAGDEPALFFASGQISELNIAQMMNSYYMIIEIDITLIMIHRTKRLKQHYYRLLFCCQYDKIALS